MQNNLANRATATKVYTISQLYKNCEQIFFFPSSYILILCFIALVANFNLFLFPVFYCACTQLSQRPEWVIVIQQFTFKRNRASQAANTGRCITSLNNCDNHRRYQCLFVCTIPYCIKKAIPAVLGSGVTHFIT